MFWDSSPNPQKKKKNKKKEEGTTEEMYFCSWNAEIDHIYRMLSI